jgi:hypothetical protein
MNAKDLEGSRCGIIEVLRKTITDLRTAGGGVKFEVNICRIQGESVTCEQNCSVVCTQAKIRTEHLPDNKFEALLYKHLKLKERQMCPES